MDDFGIGSTPPYDPYHHEQRPTNSGRKKTPPHKNVPAGDSHIGESSASDPESESNLGVQDYYTPTDRKDEGE